MSDSGTVEERLARALDRYDAALGAGDEVLVAQTRLALCQELRQAGWEAPEVAVGQMLRDAAVIEQASAEHREPPVIPQQVRRAVSPVEVLQDL
jgi:hypothetical protein